MTWQDAQAAASVGAFIAALLYFLWRFINGFFFINLSLTMESVRGPSTTDLDHLAISLVLEKGQLGGTLVIHDSLVLIETHEGRRLVETELVGTERFSFRTDDSTGRSSIWEGRMGNPPTVQMPPGDRMSFAAYAVVPAEAVCVVKATVLGKGRRGTRMGQWRCSAVSLPVDVREPASPAR